MERGGLAEGRSHLGPAGAAAGRWRRRVAASGRGEEESSRRQTAGEAGGWRLDGDQDWTGGSGGRERRKWPKCAKNKCCCRWPLLLGAFHYHIKYQTETKLHRVERIWPICASTFFYFLQLKICVYQNIRWQFD